MKTLKIVTVFTFALFLVNSAMAQKATTETIPVSGNCGMCKTKIEKAAKTAGAEEADWNADTKTLTVKYKSASTNAAKIQQGIAAVGYDTRDVRATDEAYEKLHSCCKYERKELKKEGKTGGDLTKTEAACCKKEGTGDKNKEAKSCCSDGKGH
ncbi:MAG TPA: cation transporter [Chitinophagaceae bacterium]|nr:cation transporter [Chitinophagaceae bacterium]